MKSAFVNRRLQVLAGAKKGVDYKNLIWSNPRFKTFEGKDVILVAFQPKEGEKITKALYYGKDLNGNKVLFVYEIDNKLNEKIFSLSKRVLATKSKGESFKSNENLTYQKSSYEGYSEDDWSNFSQDWVEINGYSEEDTSGYYEVFEPSCSTCGNEPYEPYETNPYEGYPDCYFDTYGCEGPPGNDSSDNGNNGGSLEDELNELESGDYKGQMKPAEIKIYNTLTTPQKIAYLVKSKSALDSAKKSGFDGQRNGLADAYRHALWNLLLTPDLGLDLTKQITDAHETGPSLYQFDYKENEMDFFNNQVGRDLASLPGNKFENVRNAVLNGQLRYLSNLDSNSLATSSSKLLSTNL